MEAFQFTYCKLARGRIGLEGFNVVVWGKTVKTMSNDDALIEFVWNDDVVWAETWQLIKFLLLSLKVFTCFCSEHCIYFTNFLQFFFCCSTVHQLNVSALFLSLATDGSTSSKIIYQGSLKLNDIFLPLFSSKLFLACRVWQKPITQPLSLPSQWGVKRCLICVIPSFFFDSSINWALMYEKGEREGTYLPSCSAKTISLFLESPDWSLGSWCWAYFYWYTELQLTVMRSVPGLYGLVWHRFYICSWLHSELQRFMWKSMFYLI